MSAPGIRTIGGQVVWTMTAEDARDLARFIDEQTTATDLARHDADLLRQAAERIDPEAGEDTNP